jgi:DsbC/DsbD-like thiol-disulfide interchange protein
MVGHVRARGKITAMFALVPGALIAVAGPAGMAGCAGGGRSAGEGSTGPASPPTGSAAEPSGEDLVALSLVADTAVAAPGRPLILAARFDIDPGWHLYWENPGEAGLATEASFQAPPGFAIGPVRYPGPIRFVSPGPVESYGYAGSVLLSAPVHVPATLEQGTASFSVEAFWLACRESCVRGSGKAELSLPVAALGSTPAPANQALMEAHAARLPRPWPAAGRKAWETGAEGSVLVLGLPASLAGGADLTYFPSTEDQLAVAGQEQAVTDGRTEVRIRYRAAPARVSGVLGAGDVFYLVELAGPAGNAPAPAGN